MKELLERFNQKAFSATWLWAAGALFVYICLSLNGTLDTQTVKDITLLIVGTYFGKSIAKNNNS